MLVVQWPTAPTLRWTEIKHATVRSLINMCGNPQNAGFMIQMADESNHIRTSGRHRSVTPTHTLTLSPTKTASWAWSTSW